MIVISIQKSLLAQRHPGENLCLCQTHFLFSPSPTGRRDAISLKPCCPWMNQKTRERKSKTKFEKTVLWMIQPVMKPFLWTNRKSVSQCHTWQTLHADHFLVPFFSLSFPPGVNDCMFPEGRLVKIQRRFSFKAVNHQHLSLETRYCVSHHTIHLACVGLKNVCDQLGDNI